MTNWLYGTSRLMALDHPVAIAPGERIGRIGRFGGRVVFAVAGDVEPVAAPALAVLRRGEELFDHLRVGAFGGILGEGFDLFVAGAQAGQVEVGALNQRARIGPGRRGQLLGFEFVQHEEVDLFPGPCLLLHDRRRPSESPAETPTTCDRLPGRSSCALSRPLGCRLGARIGRAHLDPLLESLDLLRRQLLLGRHREVRIGPADGLDQPAFFDIAGDEHRPVVAALGDARLRIEQQLAPELAGLGRMTLVTAFGQTGPNVPLEEVDAFPWCNATGFRAGPSLAATAETRPESESA